MWLIFGCMVIALFSMYERAHAYIPRTKLVLEKTAKSHGKGYYSIQIEATFRGEQSSTSVIERWIVENGESMFMEAKGGGVSIATLYKGKQKFFLDEGGAEHAAKLPSDFFEGMFHYRSWDGLGQSLVNYKITPPKVLAREPVVRSLKDVNFSHDPYIRLARTGGVIAYAIGKPTPPDVTIPFPGLWVDQDRFFIRRMRFPSQVEFTADDYGEYGQGLWYPKSRTVSWGQNSVTLRTVKVTPIVSSDEVRQKLLPSYFRSRRQDFVKSQYPQGETAALIRDFYSRFR